MFNKATGIAILTLIVGVAGGMFLSKAVEKKSFNIWK